VRAYAPILCDVVVRWKHAARHPLKIIISRSLNVGSIDERADELRSVVCRVKRDGINQPECAGHGSP